MDFEQWYRTFWSWGSGTDRLRAERAWVMARASLVDLVRDLAKYGCTDDTVGRAARFIVEAGQFYENHPELSSEKTSPAPGDLPDLRVEGGKG